MIKSNSHKYSISELCIVLQVPRSTYYYESKQKPVETELETKIVDIFKSSRNNYGTRKIKAELIKSGKVVSRRKIGRIMKMKGLISNYTVAQFKPHIDKCNESKTANLVERKFNNQPKRRVVVSDLTYVRVGKSWNYICVLVDLFNREIIGHSTGRNKDADLVARAFSTVNFNLNDIQIFHTVRGNEFKNQIIDKTLGTFKIERSLSMKGCPYDNAVAEATYKIIKTEFIYCNSFDSLRELQIMFDDYVNWFNNFRIHSSLGYLTPTQFKNTDLNIFV